MAFDGLGGIALTPGGQTVGVIPTQVPLAPSFMAPPAAPEPAPVGPVSAPPNPLMASTPIGIPDSPSNDLLITNAMLGQLAGGWAASGFGLMFGIPPWLSAPVGAMIGNSIGGMVPPGFANNYMDIPPQGNGDVTGYLGYYPGGGTN